MLSCDFYLDREDVFHVNEEIQFLSGKMNLSEERVTEIIKIGLLTHILELLKGE